MSDNRVGSSCSWALLPHEKKCKIQLGVSVAVEVVALAALAACALLGTNLGCIVSGATAGVGLIVLVCLAVRYAKAKPQLDSSEQVDESSSGKVKTDEESKNRTDSEEEQKSEKSVDDSEEEQKSEKSVDDSKEEQKIHEDPHNKFESSGKTSLCIDIPNLDLNEKKTYSMKEAEELIEEKAWRLFIRKHGDLKLRIDDKESKGLRPGDFIRTDLPCKETGKFVYAVQHWDLKKKEPEIHFCIAENSVEAKCKTFLFLSYFDRQAFESGCLNVVNNEVLVSRCKENNTFWPCEVDVADKKVHAIILYRNYGWKYLNFSSANERESWILSNQQAINVSAPEKGEQTVTALVVEKQNPEFYQIVAKIKEKLQTGQYCIKESNLKEAPLWAVIVGGRNELQFFTSQEKAIEVAQKTNCHDFDELTKKLLTDEDSLSKKGQCKNYLTKPYAYVKTELEMNGEIVFAILYLNETSEIDFRTFIDPNIRDLCLQQNSKFKEMRSISTSTSKICFISTQHDVLVLNAEKELNSKEELAYRIYNIPTGQKDVVYTVVFKEEGERIQHFDSEELRIEFIREKLQGYTEKGALERVLYGTLPDGRGNEGIVKKYHLAQFLALDNDCFIYKTDDEALKETPYIGVRAQRNLREETGPTSLQRFPFKSKSQAESWVKLCMPSEVKYKTIFDDELEDIVALQQDLTALVTNEIKDHVALQQAVGLVLPKAVKENHYEEKRIQFEEKDYDVIIWGEDRGLQWKIFPVADEKRKQEFLKRELKGYSQLIK